MKRLTKSTPRRLAANAQDRRREQRATTESVQAQCCAKVSKTVAGCHD